jgi:hypothetical protein
MRVGANGTPLAIPGAIRPAVAVSRRAVSAGARGLSEFPEANRMIACWLRKFRGVVALLTPEGAICWP